MAVPCGQPSRCATRQDGSVWRGTYEDEVFAIKQILVTNQFDADVVYALLRCLRKLAIIVLPYCNLSDCDLFHEARAGMLQPLWQYLA